MANALAEIIGTVVNRVIAVAPGRTAEDLGLVGTWIPVEDGTVGYGFAYDPETGVFTPPEEPEEVIE